MTAFSVNIPTLETDRLRLRAFREEDAPALAAIDGDEETNRFTGGAIKPDQSWRFLAMVLGHWMIRGFGVFGLEEKQSGRFIGFCGPWRPHGWPDNEIAYTLSRDCWGQGFASEAARRALDFSYDKLGWSGAISLIDPENVRSQRVAERLGAVRSETGVCVNEAFSADIWRYPAPSVALG